MTDKQKDLDETMHTLSGMVDDTVPDPLRAVLNHALDQYRDLRPWTERVRQPRGARGR